MSLPPTHLMELPRKILIGDGVISQLGSFIMDLDDNASKVAIITGNNVKARAGMPCKSSFFESSLQDSWYIVNDVSMDSVNELQIKIKNSISDFIIGIDGGLFVEVIKMNAFKLS